MVFSSLKEFSPCYLKWYFLLWKNFLFVSEIFSPCCLKLYLLSWKNYQILSKMIFPSLEESSHCHLLSIVPFPVGIPSQTPSSSFNTHLIWVFFSLSQNEYFILITSVSFHMSILCNTRVSSFLHKTHSLSFPKYVTSLSS